MNFTDLKNFFFNDTDITVSVSIDTITYPKNAIKIGADKSSLIYSDNGRVVNIDSSLKFKVSDFTSIAEIKALNQKKVTIGTDIYRIADITFDSQEETWTAHLEAKYK